MKKVIGTSTKVNKEIELHTNNLINFINYFKKKIQEENEKRKKENHGSV
jgi:hypothetical protein